MTNHEETGDNKRRRFTVLAVLLAIALALGVYKCTDTPEETDKPAASSPGSPSSVPAPKASIVKSGQKECHKGTKKTLKRHRRHCALSSSNSEEDKIIICRQTSIYSTAPEKQDTEPIKEHSVTPKQQPHKKEQPVHITEDYYPHRHLFRLGVHAGLGYSQITHLGGIMESYSVRPRFTMKENGGLSPRLGVFASWQYRRLGMELGLDYIRPCSTLKEYKSVGNVTETTKFHYDMFNPNIMVRVFLYRDFYMSAGIGAGIPFGGHNIDFTTDRGASYRQADDLVGCHLRSTLDRNVIFIPAIEMGYSSRRTGLELGIRYSFGTNDLIKTSTNDYNYNENRNNLHYVDITVGYSIPLNK